jgi:hypothetical protein
MPYTYTYERALALFSSNHLRYMDSPKKTILLYRARSHHCHRAHHLRWALRPRRPAPTVRLLKTRPILFRPHRGASAPCCGPSWLVSFAAGGRYSVVPCLAIIWVALASKYFSFSLSQGSAGICGADHSLSLSPYCAGNARSGAESASTRR